MKYLNGLDGQILLTYEEIFNLIEAKGDYSEDVYAFTTDIHVILCLSRNTLNTNAFNQILISDKNLKQDHNLVNARLLVTGAYRNNKSVMVVLMESDDFTDGSYGEFLECDVLKSTTKDGWLLRGK